jgi:hypothetical protein
MAKKCFIFLLASFGIEVLIFSISLAPEALAGGKFSQKNIIFGGDESQYEPYSIEKTMQGDKDKMKRDERYKQPSNVKETKALKADPSSPPVDRITPVQPQELSYAISETSYITAVEENIAQVKATVYLGVFKKTGWVDIPLVSTDVGLKEASLNRGAAFVKRLGNKYYLSTNKPGLYTLNLEFFLKVKREREGGPGSFSFDILPSPISELNVVMMEPQVEIFVEPSIKIDTKKEAKRTSATAILPFTERVTIHWSKALPKEVIKPVKVEPKLYVEDATLVTIGDGVARCQSILQYSILQSEVSNLRFALPKDVGILDVQGDNLRDWKVVAKDDRQIVDVYLSYGIKGAYNLSVSYERLIGEGTVTAELPAIEILDVERQKGSIGVEARTNVEIAAGKVSGVSPVDVKELPQAVWSRAANPVLLAFKYLKFPVTITIDVTKHTEVSVLVAAIDSSNSVSILTDEGKMLTKTSFQVRNNVKQFIRLQLPKHSTLWSAFVAGKPVKPAEDKKDGKILIPLEKSEVTGEILRQFPVEVVYLSERSKLGLTGRISASLAQTDIPINELYWSMYLPEEYEFFNFGGDVKRISEPGGQLPSLLGGVGGGLVQGLLKRENAKIVDAYSPSYNQQIAVEKDWGKTLRGGLLPIKIEIPTAGRFYRFSKFLVTTESPAVSAFYVKIYKNMKGIIGLLAFILFLWLANFVIDRVWLKKAELSNNQKIGILVSALLLAIGVVISRLSIGLLVFVLLIIVMLKYVKNRKKT